PMVIRLPDAASLERTSAVIDKASKIARETDGIKASIELAGLDPITFGASPNAGTGFIILEDFSKRMKKGRTADVIMAELQRKCAAIQEAFIGVFPAAAVQGLGLVGGFKLQVQDRGGAGLPALESATKQLNIAAAQQTNSLQVVPTSFRANVPQL